MHIPSSKSVTKNISPTSTVTEYSLTSDNISLATSVISGRYPDAGFAVNLDTEEIYYVISGSGTVYTESNSFRLEPKDVFYFHKGLKYWVEGDDLELVIVNTPKWTPEQHKYI